MLAANVNPECLRKYLIKCLGNPNFKKKIRLTNVYNPLLFIIL